MARQVRLASLAAGLALVAPAILSAGCGTGGEASDSAGRGACPVDPIRVVVSVSQWTDVVKGAVGDCGRVTTIVTSAAADPHEFEPTVADNAAFTFARLVVVNGAGYDAWATKVVATLHPRPTVVDGADVVGVSEGDNPHIWYGPAYVRAVGAAVSDSMTRLLPEATGYLSSTAERWRAAMVPYTQAVAHVRTLGGGTYGATEPVFDDMAAAVGLRDLTPPGYRRAALNESDPAPGDLSAFIDSLQEHRMDVLVVNVQTEGAVPDQLRKAARKAGVPVVEVTETPPKDTSFVDWQVAQLDSLAAALGAAATTAGAKAGSPS